MSTSRAQSDEKKQRDRNRFVIVEEWRLHTERQRVVHVPWLQPATRGRHDRGAVVDVVPFKAAAVIGDYVEGGSMEFDSPLVVYAGCTLHWIVRPVGTVGSNTLTVTSTVAFNGYFA